MEGEFITEAASDSGYCRVCGKRIKEGDIEYLIQIPGFSYGSYYYFDSEKCLREYNP